ncbi:unnamed protein product, partial [Staurois parvus]
LFSPDFPGHLPSLERSFPGHLPSLLDPFLILSWSPTFPARSFPGDPPSLRDPFLVTHLPCEILSW